MLIIPNTRNARTKIAPIQHTVESAFEISILFSLCNMSVSERYAVSSRQMGEAIAAAAAAAAAAATTTTIAKLIIMCNNNKTAFGSQ